MEETTFYKVAKDGPIWYELWGYNLEGLKLLNDNVLPNCGIVSPIPLYMLLDQEHSKTFIWTQQLKTTEPNTSAPSTLHYKQQIIQIQFL